MNVPQKENTTPLGGLCRQARDAQASLKYRIYHTLCLVRMACCPRGPPALHSNQIHTRGYSHLQCFGMEGVCAQIVLCAGRKLLRSWSCGLHQWRQRLQPSSAGTAACFVLAGRQAGPRTPTTKFIPCCTLIGAVQTLIALKTRIRTITANLRACLMLPFSYWRTPHWQQAQAPRNSSHPAVGL